MTGRIDEMVYRELNGVQIVQSRPARYRDANTASQRQQRKGMRNILAVYKNLKDLLHDNFEGARNGLEVYRHFLHHNLLLQHVELDEDAYRSGLCRPAPYVISEGSLPALEVQKEGDRLAFDLDWMQWHRGDILRLIHLEVDDHPAEKGGPCRLRAWYEDEIMQPSDCERVVSAPLPAGAHAYIHLRRVGYHMLCSSQRLVVV